MVLSLGYGGQKVIHAVTGLSPDTLQLGVAQLQGTASLDPDRIRRPGGGRKPITAVYPELESALLKLVGESTQGDPESPLLWTTKSLDHLARALTAQGMPISRMTVSQLLTKNHYSMQANRKRFESGSHHPDRDGQFTYIAEMTRQFQGLGNPVISVDAKKKELIGLFKNNGREYHAAKTPIDVNGHDFMDKELGKAIPYGVYDPTDNSGWVNVGTDHDTAEFAVESIRQWWYRMGRQLYPNAQGLLITADGGGSNSSRSRLWKLAVQNLADELQMPITVCHFPPGTSKWNKIEHRMFSAISLNWRGRPLTTLEVVVNLIAATTNHGGLHIQCDSDKNTYDTGKGAKISPEEWAQIRITAHENQNTQWNYTISPRPKDSQ